MKSKAFKRKILPDGVVFFGAPLRNSSTGAVMNVRFIVTNAHIQLAELPRLASHGGVGERAELTDRSVHGRSIERRLERSINESSIFGSNGARYVG